MKHLLTIAALLALGACGGTATETAETAAAAPAAGEYERGPNDGRMLRDGDFAIELAIFEDGVPPEYRAWATRGGTPVDPRQVRLAVELRRLGGRVDRFAFAPTGSFLRGNGEVIEPHSFDVVVTATEGGRTHRWAYPSYEGRTTITAEAARAGGVKTERAGLAILDETLPIAGRIEIKPEGLAEVRAVYPGRILALPVEVGERVRRGQVLARIESSYSLVAYNVTAPIDGMVTAKTANVGGVAGEAPLLTLADPNQLHAEYYLYPRDAERVRVGQLVEVVNLAGTDRLRAPVEAILPAADIASQTMLAHVHLPPGAASRFRAGMAVEGRVAVASRQVPLAVRTRALQPFRDFTVVFAKVGNTYEVRMLELGERGPEWTEIKGGLEPGTEYVTDGAFLIRSDIDKAGASHDH